MAINRSTPGTSMRSLGRISVTIDDLDALLEIIRTLGIRKPIGHARPQRPRVEFDGGSFDAAEELRKLSDEEMSSLRILTNDVQVLLNRSIAIAIGAHDHVDEIYNSWARKRQTTRRPQMWPMRIHGLLLALSSLFAFVAAAFAAVAVYTVVTDASVAMWHARSPVVNLLFSVACTIMAWLLMSNLGAGDSYAIIEPSNHEEARKELRAERVARRAWRVSVASATIAALGVLFSMLIRK